jgi:hypothetical protein
MDPAWLLLLGLGFSALGSLLLAADALGAPEFIAQLDDPDDSTTARMARIGFVAMTNQVLVIVLLCAVAAVLMFALGYERDLTKVLFLAPVAYVAWRLSVRLATWLHELSSLVKPQRFVQLPAKRLGAFLYTISLLPTLAFMLLTFTVRMVLEYGIDLPLRSISEHIIAPHVLQLLRRVAGRVSADRRSGLRKYAFQGSVLLLIGFFYQLAGTVLYLMSAGATATA